MTFNLSSDSQDWWVRDHGRDFTPFYSSSGSHGSSGNEYSAYEKYGFEEGAFEAFAKFHTGQPTYDGSALEAAE